MLEGTQSLHEIYNSLPLLDEADATTKRTTARQQLTELKRMASELANQAGLSKGELGLYLIHRHWNVPEGQVMVERPRVLSDGSIGLVTAASVVAAEAQQHIAPCRWTIGEDDSFVPLEFSSDPAVVRVWQEIQCKSDLVSGLCQAVRRVGALGQFGYMINARDTFARLPASRHLIETSRDGMSVITVHDRGPTPDSNSIVIGWPLRDGQEPNWECCWCMHGPTSCRHPLPDPPPPPPICRPHGCV